MEYKTSKISLSEKQLDLRFGLINLITAHVEERGLSREELKAVIDDLDKVLDDSRFKGAERTDEEQWEDAIFRFRDED